MRKLMLIFGRVPSSIRRITDKVLQATTWLVNVLESAPVEVATKIIPGEYDDLLRMSLIAALDVFNDRLKAAKSKRERKHIAKEIADRMVATLDGKKLSDGEYATLVQKVFDEKNVAA